MFNNDNTTSCTNDQGSIGGSSKKPNSKKIYLQQVKQQMIIKI